jgi:hypothetical protein
MLGRLNADTRVHKFPRSEAPDDTFPGKQRAPLRINHYICCFFIILFTNDHYKNYNTVAVTKKMWMRSSLIVDEI